MQYIQQIIFFLIIAFATWFFTRNMLVIKRNILLGQDEDLTDNKSVRWKNVLLLAFGQKKMFRYPMVAVFHFIIYAGFIIINIEMLEIVLDGFLGTHRLFREPLGSFYIFLINFFEVLAVLVIAVCIIFLVRRNILKLKRFISQDLDGWPRSDANYILITEIILMSLFLTMNATDPGLHNEGSFYVSGLLVPLFENSNVHLIERTAWWIHIIGILTFLNYLPYSKHLHILLAFPNAYYGKLEPLTQMDNMPNVQNEVLYMMQPELAPTGEAQPMKFGA
ncbi:MAG: Fe-S oxidoreductase, partial [Ferruginibacter sp.]